MFDYFLYIVTNIFRIICKKMNNHIVKSIAMDFTIFLDDCYFVSFDTEAFVICVSKLSVCSALSS